MEKFNGTVIIDGFMVMLTFLLSTLKFFHVIECSWWVATSPFWILVIWQTLYIVIPIMINGFSEISE